VNQVLLTGGNVYAAGRYKYKPEATLADLFREAFDHGEVSSNAGIGAVMRGHALDDLDIVASLIESDWSEAAARIATRARSWLALADEIDRRTREAWEAAARPEPEYIRIARGYEIPVAEVQL
jgi:hypothetical protein